MKKLGIENINLMKAIYFFTIGVIFLMKIFLFEKKIFDITNWENEMFFWTMYSLYIFIPYYRIKKDYDTINELNNSIESIKNMTNSELNYSINNIFIDKIKYPNIYLNWMGFKNTLFLKEGVEYQVIDAEKFFNNNIIREKMNFKLFRNWPQLFVGMGMLGTFFGLSMGLGSVNLASTEVKELVGLIQGTKTAFFTSLYGMSFSLSLSFLINIYLGMYEKTVLQLKENLNLKFKKYIKEYEFLEITKNVVEVKNSNVKLSNDVSQNIIKGINEFIKESGKYLENTNNLVQANISDLSEKISTQFEDKLKIVFSADIINMYKNLEERLQSSIRTLSNEFRIINENIEKSNQNMTEYYSILDTFSKSTVKSFSEIIDKIKNEFEKIEKINLEHIKIYNKYNTIVEDTKITLELNNSIINKVENVIENFKKISNREETIIEFWNKNKNILTTLDNMIDKSRDRELEKYNEFKKFIIENKMDLDGIVEMFNKLLESINQNVSNIDDRISQVNETVEQIVKKNLVKKIGDK